MIIKDPGHQYDLDVIDDEKIRHRLIFVKRQGPRYPGNIGHHGGTTSQEVLRALIHRAKYVNNQIPCLETKLSIWLMRAIIFLYEWRAKRIKKQWLNLACFKRIELEPTCAKCNHIRCDQVHRH